MKVQFVAVVLILLGAAASQDYWVFFHPEAVTSLKCNVTIGSLASGVRDKDGKEIFVDKYMADARAERDGMLPWMRTVGMYDKNDDGRDNAIDDCKNWIKVASRKVRIAHGGKK